MNTTMMTDDQERIASAKIVYVVAASGCGKSFTGDYLGVMHGFHHVDGGK
jgi:ABC-type nitrate/sulfonate/bicarbonate transport system ATPase subunit